jgi:anti-sigma regulatory factor (Ser/Thr protein kinase)
VLATASVVESSRDIARGRALARSFLTEVQAVHGLPVSDRVMGMVQLVVSELVTNTCKFAAGSCALTLGGSDGAVEVTVWDSAWELPVARTDDPGRVGQHGLEIAMAVCRSFEVHREPVGKRIKAAVVLADDPGGSVAGHQIG